MIILKNMHRLIRAAGLAVSLAFPFVSGDVYAQAAVAIKHMCSPLGAPAQLESIGDRDSHAIQVTRVNCRTDGGPLEGGLALMTNIWEYDQGTGILLSGDGLVRKPGAMVAFRYTAGTISLTMKDGAVTGWTASGKGVYTMATGSAVALAGKTFSWSGRPTGPGQNIQEWVMD